MNMLRSPLVAAGVALALAVAVHPRLGPLRVEAPGRALIVTLGLVLVAVLAARARHGPLAARLVALGAALALGSVAWDSLRGHRGTLSLAPGDVSQRFAELGAGGRPLGLRPLGFQAGLEELRGTTATLALAGQRVAVTPTQAAGVKGIRLGRPKVEYSGSARSLHLTLTDASGEHHVALPVREAVRHGELEVALERYFPDFALDARNEPFSRSTAPANPAALLSVRRDGRAHRVFVLAAAPGIHRVEGLDASFALAGVDAESALELRVSQAPAAPWALLGLVCACAGLALQAREAPEPRSPAGASLAAGALLCGALITLGGGGVLGWSWTSPVDGAVVAFRGVGLTLGVALLATLGGTLLVAAPVLASGAAAPLFPLTLGRRAQILGATVSGLGALLLTAQAGFGFEAGYETVLLALAASALVVALASADARALPRGSASAFVLMLAAVGMGSWLRWGGYDTPAVESVASLALLALALSE